MRIVCCFVGVWLVRVLMDRLGELDGHWLVFWSLVRVRRVEVVDGEGRRGRGELLLCFD